MCGLAGFLSGMPVANASAKLQQMAQCIAHRGPDGEGIWTDGQMGLAHRRLSIIDLDPRAGQPLQDTTSRYVIAFNGEIYNYRALRVKLIELGYIFNTDSDTEVILNSYAAWGRKFVSDWTACSLLRFGIFKQKNYFWHVTASVKNHFILCKLTMPSYSRRK